jgi:hypothetical protein
MNVTEGTPKATTINNIKYSFLLPFAFLETLL